MIVRDRISKRIGSVLRGLVMADPIRHWAHRSMFAATGPP
jgi:hypothetical protein